MSDIDNIHAKQVWKNIGDWWDEQMAEGDSFHQCLIHPTVIQLLDLESNDKVIDIACGNGALTRGIAKKVKQVVGIDFSASLLDNAKKRTQAMNLDINYKELDLTNPHELKKIHSLGLFNKAVCSMAIQDIENIDPLIQAIKDILLKPSYFVISIPHPCFNSGKISILNDDQKKGILRNEYISPVRLLVYAKENQPQPHPHFHRTIAQLFDAFFKQGFIINGLIEPSMKEYDLNNKFADTLWGQFPEIPPAMVIRFSRNQT